MNCHRCNSELIIENEQVGIDRNNAPVFHRIAYCEKCDLEWDLDYDDYYPEKKKHSTLSCVACALSGVSVIFPMFLFFGLLLSFSGMVVGVIDLCLNNHYQKHLGSWFSLIVFVLYLIILFL